MAENTGIGWTDHTFNPWLGCQHWSKGCDNCYADVFTTNRMGLDVFGGRSKRQRTKGPWREVLKWNRQAEHDTQTGEGLGRPHRVFTGSMCDIFEDAPGPNEWRSAVWDLIRVCPWLDFQLLTKRPENIAAMLPGDWAEVETGDRGGYPNVWLGTSIEDRTVVERARVLAEIPAFRRFISYEPAIGPVFMDGRTDAGGQDERFWRSVPAGHGGRADPELDLDGIDWLIVGGESGSAERRPMNLDWARDAQAACYYAGVPFFFKQLGGAKPGTGEDALGEIVHEYPTSWDRADFVPDGQLV